MGISSMKVNEVIYLVTLRPLGRDALNGCIEQGCHGTGETGNLEVHFSRQGKRREFVENI